MTITGEQAWIFIQQVLPRVRSDVSRMKNVLDQSDKGGLFSRDAIDAAFARDELRELADQLDEMISQQDMKDAA